MERATRMTRGSINQHDSSWGSSRRRIERVRWALPDCDDEVGANIARLVA
jgi:hypothetical protein